MLRIRILVVSILAIGLCLASAIPSTAASNTAASSTTSTKGSSEKPPEITTCSQAIESTRPAAIQSCPKTILDTIENRVEIVDVCPQSAKAIRAADGKFWYTFHNQRYDLIPALQCHLENGLFQAEHDPCGTFLMNARLGFLYTWRLAEIGIIAKAESKIANASHHSAHASPQSKNALASTAAKGGKGGAPHTKMSPRSCCDAGTHCPAYSTLSLGCQAEDHFESALCVANGFVQTSFDGTRPEFQIPKVEGGGKLLPAVVQGFYAGSFGFSRHASGETADQANAWEEELIAQSIEQTGWFNVATPPALAENTSPAKIEKKTGADGKTRKIFEPAVTQQGGQNLSEIWQLFALCADKDQWVPAGEDYGPYSWYSAPDRPRYVRDAQAAYANAAWRTEGDVPSDEIFSIFCYDNVNVPHVYEGNYLYMGDIMVVSCGLFTGIDEEPDQPAAPDPEHDLVEYSSAELTEMCDEVPWRELALGYYEDAQRSGKASNWPMMDLIDNRVELAKKLTMASSHGDSGATPPASDDTAFWNLIGEIGKTANTYPVCMVCHQN